METPKKAIKILAADGTHTKHTEDGYTKNEITLAYHNHGMQLEGLAYPITPTGMHYLLIHYDIPQIDVNTYELKIKGLVNKPLSFTLDDIKKHQQISMPVTLECAGNGRNTMSPRYYTHVPWGLQAMGTSMWTGTPLKNIIADCGGLKSEAKELLFTGRDKGIQGHEVQQFQRSLKLDEVMRDDVILAWEMNGLPLPPQHGYPLRLIVPGWYGFTSVKWLDNIEAISEPFNGHQMKAYSYVTDPKDLDGERMTLQKVRSVMIPPGFPDFFTRSRTLIEGPTTLRGRAWSGRKSITRVEVSTDKGKTWSDATLEKPVGQNAWTGWSYNWNATKGKYTVMTRATDSEGNVQPIEQAWNSYGMANTSAHSIDVNVVTIKDGAIGAKL